MYSDKVEKGYIFSCVILILDLRVNESRNDQFDQNEAGEGQKEQPCEMGLLVGACRTGKRKNSHGDTDAHYDESKLNFEQNAILVVYPRL